MSLFDQYNWQGTRGFPYFWGWYWLGPINNALPPNPPGLTDTVTGTVYFLLLNSAHTAIILTATPPPFPHIVLPKSNYLFLGASGIGLQVTSGAIAYHTLGIQAGQGPPVFAPTSYVGIPTAVGGLSGYIPGDNLKNTPIITLTVGTITAHHTPSEPTMIPQPVAYNGYYYQLQDNHAALP